MLTTDVVLTEVCRKLALDFRGSLQLESTPSCGDAGRKGVADVKNILSGVGMVVLASALVGCSGAGGAGGEEAAPDSTGESSIGSSQAKLIYSINVSERHKIQFFDYGYGVTGMAESLPVEEGPAIFKDLNEEPHTLVELFRMARPNEAVPEVLAATDARAAVIKADFERQVAANPGLLHEPDAAPEPPKGGENVGESQQAIVACSTTDYYNDNWGASWFDQNFGFYDFTYKCSGGFTDVKKAFNKSSVTLIENPYSGQVWKQMEGDFNRAGWTTGYLRSIGLGSSFYLWNHAVDPRIVWIHNVNPTTVGARNEVSGSSPCGHMHYALNHCRRI